MQSDSVVVGGVAPREWVTTIRTWTETVLPGGPVMVAVSDHWPPTDPDAEEFADALVTDDAAPTRPVSRPSWAVPDALALTPAVAVERAMFSGGVIVTPLAPAGWLKFCDWTPGASAVCVVILPWMKVFWAAAAAGPVTTRARASRPIRCART